MAEVSPEHCRLIVPLLRKRDGISTHVYLSGDRSIEVFDIAWGTDLGFDFEHVTTNISPSVKGRSVDFFFTNEVSRIVDPASGATLWNTDGDPIVWRRER